MLRVKVINAEKLPLSNNQPPKTKLCFSSISSLRFMNCISKITESTTSPYYNVDTYIPFFRCGTLSFTIYSVRPLKEDELIGRVDINFPKFLIEHSIENFESTPFEPIKQTFPITSCVSSRACLTIEFSSVALTYNPISFDKLRSPFFNVFTTYSPPVQFDSKLPVEIELFQAFPVMQTEEDKKSHVHNGIYYYLTKDNTWDEVGFSTNENCIAYPTGKTQLQTCMLNLINDKAEVFVLNVGDYTGTITVNFIGGHKGKFKTFSEGECYVSKSSDFEIDRFLELQIKVEKNKKYVVPVLITDLSQKLPNGQIVNEFPLLEFEKNSDFSEEQLEKQILDEILKINTNWQKTNFSKASIIPSSQKVSLSKILNEHQLPPVMNFKVYMGGSAKNYQNNITLSSYWTPTFIVLDSKSGTRCTEIEESLVSDENMKNCKPAVNYLKKQIYGSVWTFCVDLNLDSIGPEKVVVLCVKSGSVLENSQPPGSLTIVDAEKGTLLLRKHIVVDKGEKSHFGTCLRFQRAEGGWEAVPMFEFFSEEEKMISYVDSLYKNDWKQIVEEAAS